MTSTTGNYCKTLSSVLNNQVRILNYALLEDNQHGVIEESISKNEPKFPFSL